MIHVCSHRSSVQSVVCTYLEAANQIIDLSISEQDAVTISEKGEIFRIVRLMDSAVLEKETKSIKIWHYQGRKHQSVPSIYSVLSSYSFRNHSCHHVCNCTNGPYPDTPGIHLKANFIRSSAVEESFLSQEHPVISDTVKC